MSQAKVDRYKQEKANRKKTMAKQKAMSVVWKIVAIAIIAALAVWAGFSIHNWMVENAPTTYTYVNLTPLTDYLGNLSVQ